MVTGMTGYRVKWEIDVDGDLAGSQWEAAEVARMIMLDPESDVATFSVDGQLIDLGESELTSVGSMRS